jgi:hypothetical protein
MDIIDNSDIITSIINEINYTNQLNELLTDENKKIFHVNNIDKFIQINNILLEINQSLELLEISEEKLKAFEEDEKRTLEVTKQLFPIYWKFLRFLPPR